MKIEPSKIKELIDKYGEINQIPERKRLKRFTEDHELNYKQWAAFVNGGQDAGYKVVDIFMDIFPDIDLNWFIKDEEGYKYEIEEKINLVNEPSTEKIEKPKKEISNAQIFLKLNEVLMEVKKISNEKMTQK